MTTMFKMLKSTPELLQEADIIFKIETEIIYLVLEHGRSFNSHSESESGIFSAVDITCLKNSRMNHSASKNLQPTCVFADIAALAPADSTADIHLSRWFRKGKI